MTRHPQIKVFAIIAAVVATVVVEEVLKNEIRKCGKKHKK
jgi:hypothetical protein